MQKSCANKRCSSSDVFSVFAFTQALPYGMDGDMRVRGPVDACNRL